MIRTCLNGAALGVAAIALAACAETPAYPTGSEPATTRAAAPPPAASAPVATPPPAPVPAPITPAPAAPVETSALPPVPLGAEALSPAPSPAPAEPPPVPLASPPPAYRTLPARYAAEGKVVHPRGMYRDYAVRPKDHLDAIARDLQVTPDELVSANHLKDADQLRPGQHLRIPVEKAYVAKPGDTLADVAKRFSVGAAELADLNDLSSRARLSSGEEIALPSDIHDRGPVEVAPQRTVRLYSPSAPTSEGAALPRSGVYAPSPYVYSPPPLAVAPRPETPAPDQTQVVAMAKGRFVWPLQGPLLSKFGVTGVGERNDGIDIAAPLGTVVKAAAAGNVVYAGDQIPGFGNLVLVQHPDGWVTAYAHLERIGVQMRQTVAQGQEIGQVGQSGGATQPELHFEIRFKASAGDKARPIDPLTALPEGAGTPSGR